MYNIVEKWLSAFHLPLQDPVLIFVLILFIILVMPLLFGRLKIPSIIGLIVSGILIGPYGFGWVANDSAVEMFSTIGSLYIMFIAGLDLDLNDFKLNKHKSLLFGAFTFIL